MFWVEDRASLIRWYTCGTDSRSRGARRVCLKGRAGSSRIGRLTHLAALDAVKAAFAGLFAEEAAAEGCQAIRNKD